MSKKEFFRDTKGERVIMKMGAFMFYYYRKIIITIFCFYVISFCIVVQCKKDFHTNQNLEAEQPRVTIWVHGTRLNTHFPLNIIKPLVDFDMHLNTPISGLHKIEQCPADNHVITIAKTLNSSSEKHFPLDFFYAFGWSGKLKHQERVAKGRQLRQEIEAVIIKPLRARYGKDPLITIITHSHGGNVALNMAHDIEGTIPFQVDSLILLACPVQLSTYRYVESPLFKKIYSLYSENDMMQVIDPQIFQSIKSAFSTLYQAGSLSQARTVLNKDHLCFFSNRTFLNHNKLLQIRVSWDASRPWLKDDFSIYGLFKAAVETMHKFSFFKSRGMYHIEFLIPSFLSQLLTIINHPYVVKEFCSFALR